MAIECRFEYHFICRIAKLGTPQKMGLDRLGQRDDRRQKDINLLIRQSRRQPVLRLAADRFIFQGQSHAREQFRPPLQRSPGRAGRV